MASFQNILIGIDLTQCEQLAIEALPAITQNVFHYSVWLARKTGARLTFLSALNLTAESLNMLAEKHRLASTCWPAAHRTLPRQAPCRPWSTLRSAPI